MVVCGSEVKIWFRLRICLMLALCFEETWLEPLHQRRRRRFAVPHLPRRFHVIVGGRSRTVEVIASEMVTLIVNKQIKEIEYQVPGIWVLENKRTRSHRSMKAQKLGGVIKYLSEDRYLIPHSRWRSQVSTMKSRMYPQNLLLLYLLLLYSRTYYTY